MLRGIPTGDIVAFIFSCLVVANPIKMLEGVSLGMSVGPVYETEQAVEKVPEFINFPDRVLYIAKCDEGDQDCIPTVFHWSDLGTWLGIIIGALSLIHAVYSKIQDRRYRDG